MFSPVLLLLVLLVRVRAVLGAKGTFLTHPAYPGQHTARLTSAASQFTLTSYRLSLYSISLLLTIPSCSTTVLPADCEGQCDVQVGGIGCLETQCHALSPGERDIDSAKFLLPFFFFFLKTNFCSIPSSKGRLTWKIIDLYLVSLRSDLISFFYILSLLKDFIGSKVKEPKNE